MKNLMIKSCVVLLLAGCGTEDDMSPEGETTPTEARGESCSEPVAVSCVDEMILDLSYQTTVAQTEVTNIREGQQWITAVDATAGGFQNASTNPWIYFKFTDEGAEKVEISDEDSLESMEWHLAAHRYKIRLNSGSGGPSCVKASALLESTYEELTEVPEGLTFYEDTYYNDDCTLIGDSFGMGGAQFYMSNWWDYPGCVATTGVPFIIQIEDGRRLRLRVDSYYESGQDECNENGTMGVGSARLSMRWGFFYE